MFGVGPRLTRRRVVLGTALAALSATVAVVRLRGYDEPWQTAVIRHLARRVCAAITAAPPAAAGSARKSSTLTPAM